MNIQTNDSDGSVVIYGNPDCLPVEKPGYTIRAVDKLPARPADDLNSMLSWVDPGGLAWIAPPATLATLSAALNASLTALFKTAPLQAQITYSNITAPVADLISAGQLTAAISAFQGMIDDDLVPPKYAPLLTSAIAQITAQEAAFAAVMPAPVPTPAVASTFAASASTAISS